MDFKTDYPGWPNLITEALTSKDAEQIQLKSEIYEVWKGLEALVHFQMKAVRWQAMQAP